MGKLFILLLAGTFLHAQTEFKEFDNGFIYSPEAISKLQQIVGKKNEEFRKCDLSKDFISIPQTKGFYIELKPRRKKISGLITDLKSNISLQDFKSNYKPDLKFNSRLLVKTRYKGYDNKEYIRIAEEPDGRSIKFESNIWESSKFKNWIFNEYSNGVIGVFYLEEEFKSLVLPKKYSKFVQYAECLIDTTKQIYFEGAQKDRLRKSKPNDSSKQAKVFQYIQNEFDQKEPTFGEGLLDLEIEETIQNGQKQFDQYLESRKQWEKSRQLFIAEELSKRKEFISSLEEAYQESLETKSSKEELEELISKYLSKEKALQLKRNRIVIGYCSQDMSPRIHAMNIAQLSAESYNWDIFLRAHLNIMNDRFHRASDGSYAWGARKTYIKELEALNIDVPFLMYGISLRVGNPAKNHYYSNIRRAGRAIAESKDKKLINDELVGMIKDEDLDDYNRLILFYLYHNFQYNMRDNYNKEKIKKIASLLPAYIIPKIK